MGNRPEGSRRGHLTPAIRNYTKTQRQRIYDAYTFGTGVDGRPRR